MVETLFAKASRFDVFFLVFRQKSRNDHGIESRIRGRKREGGESSHRTKGILTIRRCGRQGDSIGPCETFDSSRKRKHFHTITFYLMCATVHSHVTCTPVETIIGRTWWNVSRSTCFRGIRFFDSSLDFSFFFLYFGYRSKSWKKKMIFERIKLDCS